MNHIITSQNDFSYLLTNDTNLKYKLWKALRFREKDYIHSRLYRQRMWDGYKDFFNKESGKFLTGLLPEVMASIKYLGHDYELDDKRTKIDFLYQTVDERLLSKFSKNSITLHDYQIDYINQIIKNKRGIVFAPTGSGKTFVMMGIVLSLPANASMLLLVNSKSLAEQNYEELMKWKVPNVGRLYDKYQDINTITVATIQSIHKIEKLIPKISVCLVDEIHDMISKRCIKCYKKLTNCSVRVGFSATPFKDGDACQKYNVKGYFGPILKTKAPDAEKGVLDTKTLQDRHILSGSICRFYPILEPLLPYAIYQDAVTYGIAENWYFHSIVKKLVATLKGRTLILVERTSHGDALSQAIPGSLWVQGKDNLETRKFVIGELQKSKEDVVAISTKIFNAGTNVFIHNLIICSGGKSSHLTIQRMGRGLRIREDKNKILNYYDFIFENNPYLKKHSMKRIKVLQDQGHEVIIERVFGVE